MNDNKIIVADDANEVDDTVAAVSAVLVTAAADITDDDDTPASRESLMQLSAFRAAFSAN